jgi:hypothetical protein
MSMNNTNISPYLWGITQKVVNGQSFKKYFLKELEVSVRWVSCHHNVPSPQVEDRGYM